MPTDTEAQIKAQGHEALSLPSAYARLEAELQSGDIKVQGSFKLPALITLKRNSAAGKLDSCIDPATSGPGRRPRYVYQLIKAHILGDALISEPPQQAVQQSQAQPDQPGDVPQAHEATEHLGSETEAQPDPLATSAQPLTQTDPDPAMADTPSAALQSPIQPEHVNLIAQQVMAVLAQTGLLQQAPAANTATEQNNEDLIAKMQEMLRNELRQHEQAIEAQIQRLIQSLEQAQPGQGANTTQQVQDLVHAIQSVDALSKQLMIRYDAENTALRQRHETISQNLAKVTAESSSLDNVRLLALLQRLENKLIQVGG